jgi:predicted lipoprotein with Yx(FWY)xxD motif
MKVSSNEGREQRVARSPLTRTPRRLAGVAIPLLAIGSLAAFPLASGAAKHASSPKFLLAVSVSKYGVVLPNAHRDSLYILSTEHGTKEVCNAACQQIWVPLMVSPKLKSITIGPGVRGNVGFINRSKTSDQVTYNGYPLFTYVSDTGPRQTHGEGIVSFGGTWGLVRASAKTSSTTFIRKVASTTTSTNPYVY